jgi:HAD superfamily hydrolase (TIGR01509 family)
MGRNIYFCLNVANGSQPMQQFSHRVSKVYQDRDWPDMPLQAIIFDLDGTLIDTETPDFELWRAFYAQHQLDLAPEMWVTRVGRAQGTPGFFDPAEHFSTLTGITLDGPFLAHHHDRYLASCAAQPALPGARQLVDAARQAGLKIGLASNSEQDWVKRWLTHYDLINAFDCLCTRDEVFEPKPHPAMYQLALDRLGVSAEQTVAIEDSPTGMEAALAAGIRCIGVPSWLTEHLPRPKVDLLVKSLVEIDIAKLQAWF